MTFEDQSVFRYGNNAVKLNNGGVKSLDVNFDRDIYISRWVYQNEAGGRDLLLWKCVIAILLFITPLKLRAFEVELLEIDSLFIIDKLVSKKIKLDTTINGYSVNCAGSKIMLWGKPKKINETNPQSTDVILIDLNKSYKKHMIAVSSGAFDIDYLKSNDYAYIGSNQGLLVNLSNGRVIESSSDFDPTSDSKFESCEKNKSWSFNRYQ